MDLAGNMVDINSLINYINKLAFRKVDNIFKQDKLIISLVFRKLISKIRRSIGTIIKECLLDLQNNLVLINNARMQLLVISKAINITNIKVVKINY